MTQSEECSQSRIWSGKKHYWIYFWVLKETFDKKHFHERFCIKALKIWSVIFFWIRPSNIKCGMLQSTRRSSWKFQQWWWWWTTLRHAYFSNVEWVWSNLELVDFHNLSSIRKVILLILIWAHFMMCLLFKSIYDILWIFTNLF